MVPSHSMFFFICRAQSTPSFFGLVVEIDRFSNSMSGLLSIHYVAQDGFGQSYCLNFPGAEMSVTMSGLT